MEQDWVKVASVSQLQYAELLRSFLADNNISAVTINKKDSAYPAFGEVELYVHRDQVLRASQLINRFNEEQPL